MGHGVNGTDEECSVFPEVLRIDIAKIREFLMKCRELKGGMNDNP
jgi:hypothetical protein